MTRHPATGAVERREVTAGELAELKAVARFAAPWSAGAVLYSAGKLPRANLLKNQSKCQGRVRAALGRRKHLRHSIPERADVR
jgi:hypothetical protein